MNIGRIGVLLSKELRYGTRSFIFIFATVIPVAVSLIVSLVFGRLFAGNPRLGLLDLGQSQLPGLFRSQDYLDAQRYTSADQLRLDVERGVVEMGLIVPDGFDAAARESRQTDLTIYFWGEGAISNRAMLITALANNVVTVSGRNVPITVEPVLLGESAISSWSERLLPLLVLMAIVLGGTLVPAVSLVNEKQQRTLVALTVTPTSLGEVMTSKALLGAGISLLMGLIILALNRMFGGQPLLLAFVLGLGAATAAIFGILLGTLVKDMNGLFAIVKAISILLYAPAIINMIPQLPQGLAQIFPTYYIMAPIVEITQRGGGLAEIGGYLAVLFGLTVLLCAVTVYIARNQERRSALAG